MSVSGDMAVKISGGIARPNHPAAKATKETPPCPPVRNNFPCRFRAEQFREDFRPFAPAVLAEDAGTYFELTGDSPYMLFVLPVRAAWRERLGAVSHVDGTARVQTVRREADPDFHRLFSACKSRSGIGMLLNTSLNRRGQPMVETPGEALALLRETGLDDLAIRPWLVRRTGDRARPQ